MSGKKQGKPMSKGGGGKKGSGKGGGKRGC
jgi:hypothetical protein